MSSNLAMLLAAVGFRQEPNRFAEEADELARAARELRRRLEAYKDAPDPLGAFLSDIHNNREFRKP